MKQQPSQFGQAIMQLAQARQQVAGLEAQVEKLKSDIKELRDLDHAIFDEQEKQIVTLKSLIRDFVALLEDDDLMIEDCSDGWYERRRGALSTAEQLLSEES